MSCYFSVAKSVIIGTLSNKNVKKLTGRFVIPVQSLCQPAISSEHKIAAGNQMLKKDNFKE